MELKPRPFCGGKAKISYKDYLFYGFIGKCDRKLKYRVQVICNKCHSRGKPIITEWLVDPNPYARREEQVEMFALTVFSPLDWLEFEWEG